MFIRRALSVISTTTAFVVLLSLAPAVNATEPADATLTSSAGFDPALEPASRPAAVVAVPDSPQYVPAATPKRTARRVQSSRASLSAASGTAATDSKLRRAKAILARQVARYPILRGTTVEIGDAKGYQAISYYKSGRIVISPSHRASLERIIAHEIWHIIDWRHNNRIDWGENIPPKNASRFATK